MLTTQNQNIYTVSRLNAEVRLLLENQMGIVWLVGEISNFSAPVSGHWYFSLKDSRAQVKCAMFRGNNRHVSFKPENGKQVLVKARLSLYEPRGDYQVIVESMQPEGDGQLQQQFDALKMKLAAEGLFAQSSKLPIPEHPKMVGVVTSKTGAALHDILDVLKRRDPTLEVIIYPTLVQGEEAAISIAQAIGRANERKECDVLIVGRGGGSMEDLWSFNQEIVARTIVASQIPIISAVGHEVDVTIADFVADLRAPTPSAAAELVSRDHSHKAEQIAIKQRRMQRGILQILQQKQSQISIIEQRLEKHHPQYKLERQWQKLDDLSTRLQRAIQTELEHKNHSFSQQQQRLLHISPATQIHHKQNHLQLLQQRLQQHLHDHLTHNQYQLQLAMEKLDAISPLAVLKRGYSITTTESGEVVKSAVELQEGQVMVSKLDQGEVHSKVLKVID